MHVNGKRFALPLLLPLIVVVVTDCCCCWLLLLLVVVVAVADWLVALLPKVLSGVEWRIESRKRVWCEWWECHDEWPRRWRRRRRWRRWFGILWRKMKWNEMKRKLWAAHVLLAASTRMIWQQIWKPKCRNLSRASALKRDSCTHTGT